MPSAEKSNFRCRHCGRSFPGATGPGRPAAYCSPACRQAAYRVRQRRTPTALPRTPSPSPEAPTAAPAPDEGLPLLEFVQDTQEDIRHLARLLLNTRYSAYEAVQLAVSVQRRAEVLTAGTVHLARQRGVSLEALGAALHLSPTSVRHKYCKDRVARLFQYFSNQQPAPRPPSRPIPGNEDSTPPPSGPPSRRASTELAPVLSRMQAVSGLPLRRLGLRTGVSASYLSRVLSGQKFPSWELTEGIVLALGGDLATVRSLWQREREQELLRATLRHDAPVPGLPEPTSCNPVHTAVQMLYERADRPSPSALAAATKGRLSTRAVRRILDGHTPREWEHLAILIRILDGEPGFFRPHWQKASRPAAPPDAPSREPEPNRRQRVLRSRTRIARPVSAAGRQRRPNRHDGT